MLSNPAVCHLGSTPTQCFQSTDVLTICLLITQNVFSCSTATSVPLSLHAGASGDTFPAPSANIENFTNFTSKESRENSLYHQACRFNAACATRLEKVMGHHDHADDHHWLQSSLPSRLYCRFDKIPCEKEEIWRTNERTKEEKKEKEGAEVKKRNRKKRKS